MLMMSDPFRQFDRLTQQGPKFLRSYSAEVAEVDLMVTARHA